MIFNLLTETSKNNGGSQISSYIMMGILVLVLILFFVMSSRSNKKKKAEAEAMMAKFRKGCIVKTIGGIIGKVVAINDNDGTFILETGSNKQKSVIKFDKQAIYQITEGKKQPKEKVEKAEVAEEVKEEPATEVIETAEVVEEVKEEPAEKVEE